MKLLQCLNVLWGMYYILRVGVIALRMYSLHTAHFFYAMQLSTVTYYTGPEKVTSYILPVTLRAVTSTHYICLLQVPVF